MSAVQDKAEQSRFDWRAIFALDVRSLAMFRIFAGLIILADLIFRLPTLCELFTEQGFMTRSFAAEYYQVQSGEYWHFAIWSLYWICGAAWWHYLLFWLAAVFATMLVLGYRTRLATVGSWALLASLHTANPFVITSGDTIFRLSLFWSIFIPLGQVWSLDARRKNRIHPAGVSNESDDQGRAIFSMATVCFIIQFMILYIFTGIAKCNSDWFSGEAMHYVLRLNIYVYSFGTAMLKYPLLLKFIAYATLFTELILIWCLLIPWKNAMWRGVVLLTFVGFHVGIMLALEIGFFSLICIAIWTAFLPSQFWKLMPNRLNSDSLPSYVPRANHPAVSLFCAATIGFVIVLHLFNTGSPVFKKLLPYAIQPYAHWLALDQRFQMFGRPPRFNPWFVYEATLANGKTVNPFQEPPGEPTSNPDELHQPPVNYRKNLPTFHWRKVHRNMVSPAMEPYRERLAEYAVQKWNSEHAEESDAQIVHLKLFCYLESTDRSDADSFGQSTVWATWGDAVPDETIDAKVDNILDQLLEEDPAGRPF